MQIHELTHKLLAKHLELDSFDSLLQEVNLSVSSTYGRIINHISFELLTELLPNYCYNNTTKRFVLTKIRMNIEPIRVKPPVYCVNDLWGSKPLHKIYEEIYSLYSGFFGQEHFKLVHKYLGYYGIALVTNQFLDQLQNMVIFLD